MIFLLSGVEVFYSKVLIQILLVQIFIYSVFYLTEEVVIPSASDESAAKKIPRRFAPRNDIFTHHF
jgi:hypothetical protein